MAAMNQADQQAFAEMMRDVHTEQTAKVLGISRDRIDVHVQWHDDGGLGVVTLVDGKEFDPNSEEGVRILEAIHKVINLPNDPHAIN